VKWAEIVPIDPNGNRLSQSETLDGVTEQTTYTYDNSDRLETVRYPSDTAFPGGRTVTYGYDTAGNRETEVTRHPGTQAILASKTGTFDKINRLTALTDIDGFIPDRERRVA
jgi:hypothetical protein